METHDLDMLGLLEAHWRGNQNKVTRHFRTNGVCSEVSITTIIPIIEPTKLNNSVIKYCYWSSVHNHRAFFTTP